MMTSSLIRRALSALPFPTGRSTRSVLRQGLTCLLIVMIGGSAWSQPCYDKERQKIFPGAGAPYDYFGRSVCVSGNVAIVGAYFDDTIGTDAGAAHIYRFDGLHWIYEQTIYANNGRAGDYFGYSVCVKGDLAIVGAYGTDSSGSAYMFRFDQGTHNWSQVGILQDPSGTENDGFGETVAVDGDVAIVGSSGDDDRGVNYGSAFVFHDNGFGWVQAEQLGEGDGFGTSVAVEGNRLIVGAARDSTIRQAMGAAYVYERVGGTWTLRERLSPGNGWISYNFGDSVSLSGDVALVGAAGRHTGGTGWSYVFRFDGLVWNEEQELIPSDATAGDQIGFSVSLSGDIALVGAPLSGQDGLQKAGGAYVFRYQADVNRWVETKKLVARDGMAFDELGISVSVSGSAAFLGAWRHTGSAPGSGAAYVYDAIAPKPLEWVFNGCPLGGGAPVHFTAFASDELMGHTAYLFLSLGNGDTSGGVPVPRGGGRKLYLDPDAVFLAWLTVNPALRVVTLNGCTGASTTPFSLPWDTPSGVTLYFAGFSVDEFGQVSSVSETNSFTTK